MIFMKFKDLYLNLKQINWIGKKGGSNSPPCIVFYFRSGHKIAWEYDDEKERDNDFNQLIEIFKNYQKEVQR
ncbi:MAG: hypothetical protein QXD29_01895 [Thermoplasmata archaeon]